MISLKSTERKSNSLEVEYSAPYAATDKPTVNLTMRQNPEAVEPVAVSLRLNKLEAAMLVEYLRRAFELP